MFDPNQKGGNMQENLIKLHSIILDGDLTEAAKLCDELIAAHQQNAETRAMAHTSTDQPVSLYYADLLDSGEWINYATRAEAATELRRLHARVKELEAEKARLIETYVPCPSATEVYLYGITQEKQG